MTRIKKLNIKNIWYQQSENNWKNKMSVKKEIKEIEENELTKELIKMTQIPKDVIIIIVQYTLTWTEKYVGQIGSHGSGNGQLKYPYGIAIKDNKIYVVDTYNHRIQKYKRELV